MSTITKSDDFFKYIFEVANESRRHLQHRYKQDGDIDLNGSIPIYTGKSICKCVFDFTVDGPRCRICNSLCLLTDDGDFKDKEIITIRTGSYRGQQIQVFKHPRNDSANFTFCNYSPVNHNINSHLNNINNVCSKRWLRNNTCNASHDYAISCLINTSSLPFKSKTIFAWICDEVNVLKFVPSLGSFKNAIFTHDLFKNTFFQLYCLSFSKNFSHGDPNANVLYLSNIPSSCDGPNKTKVEMASSLFFDVSEYSSFCTDSNGLSLYYTGKSHVSDIEEPHWNMSFKLTTSKLLPRQHTKSPCKKSYLTRRLTTFIPTIEIMNYVRQTGINVFPHMYFIIYMAIVLMNRSFYDIYINNEASRVFSLIFVDDDYSRFMDIVVSNLGKDPTCDEIIMLLNENRIQIRDDSLEYIKGEMFKYILKQ